MRLADIAQTVAQYGAQRYFEKRAGVGVALPLGVGLGLALPGQMKDVGKTYHETRRNLDQAALEQLVPDVARGFKHAGLTDFMQGMSGMSPQRNPAVNPENLAKGQDFPMLDPSQGAMAGDILGPLLTASGLPVIQAPGKALGTRIERRLSGREFGEKKDPARLLGQFTLGGLGKGMGLIGADLLKDIAVKAMATTRKIHNDSARTAILDQLKQEDPILHDADDTELMDAYHTMTRFAPVLSTDKNAVRSFLRQAIMSGTGPDYVTIKLLADSENAVTGFKPGSKRNPWI